MALFDLARIIESLQFGKLKTRNEALNTLSDYSIDNLRLSPKQFTALLKGLIRSLQEERDASNANPAAAKRITNTLTLIYELVESTLLDTSTRTRYKTICDFGITLSEYYRSIHSPSNDSDNEMLLQVISFKTWIAKIMTLMLSNWPVFTHLLQDLWYQYYEFCIDAIKEEIFALKQKGEIQYYSISNENLLVELFSVLLCLIGVNDSHSFITLISKRSYQPLYNLIDDSFNCFKQKETPLHILILKIINKLLKLVATEDIWFSHCLSNLGVKVILQFASSRTESLATQICLLLNSETFHRYLDSDNFAAETLKKSQDTSSLKARIDSQVRLYSIEKILDLQIGLVQSLKLRLTESDIEVVRANTNVPSMSFHLGNVQLVSDNTLGWLLLNGISKTLLTCFRLRRSTQHVQSNTNVFTRREASTSTDEPLSKKRKIADCKLGVSDSQNEFEYIYRMLNSIDPSEQICALQILVFLLGSKEFVIGLQRTEGTDELEVDASKLIQKAVALTSKAPFWALLVCQSLLAGSKSLVSNFAIINQSLQSLLKFATSSIGDCLLYQVSAEILFSLSLNCGIPSLKDGLPNCFEEIINSPIISGPPRADVNACLVWVSLSNIYLNLNMNYRKQFYTSMMTWVLERFSRSFDKDATTKWSFSWHLSILVGWIVGTNTKFLEKSENYEPMQCTPLRNNPSQNELEFYISFEKPYLKAKGKDFILRFPVLSIPPELVKNLLTKICSIYTNFQALCLSPNLMVCLSLTLGKISFFCKERYESESVQLNLLATELMLTLARFIKNKEDAALVVSTILSLSPSRETLEKLNFPFEIIDYRFRSLPIPNSALHIDASHSFLEEEFSQSDSNRPSARTKSPEEKLCPSFDVYIKFIIRFQDNCMEKILTFLQTLSPKEKSQYVDLCLDFLDCNKSSVTQADCLKLVRFIGEKCLSLAELERDFNLLILCCKSLELICRIWDEKQLIQKDYNDLFSYIQNLESKRMVLSGEFYCHFAALNYVANQASPELSFTNSLAYTSNVNAMRVSLIYEIGTLKIDKKRSSLRFKSVYSFVAIKFGQNAVEHDATGCFIILKYIKQFPSLAPLGVKTLALLSRFAHMVPYITICISAVAQLIKEANPSALLESNSISILKSWYIQNGTLDDFPYQIFGYSNDLDFRRNNYRGIICVLYAIDVKEERAQFHSEVERLSISLGMKETEIWVSCIPKMVPLAYTSNGFRNDIFHTIEQSIKESYKPIMEELLNLTILETLLMTDYSAEESLLKAFNFSSATSLFDPKSEVFEKPEDFISPNSSKGLILALIEHYEKRSPTKYWTGSSIHFFVRRLSITTFRHSFEKIRAIKFFLCIARFDFKDSIVLEMLLELSSDYVSLEFSTLVASLIDKLKFDCLEQLPLHESEKADCCILKIISAYLSYPNSGDCSMKILESLENFLSKKDNTLALTSAAKRFYIDVVKFVKDPSCCVDLRCIEEFFEDPALSNTIKMNKRRIHSILLEIFPSTSLSSPSYGSKNLISIFLDHSLRPGSNLFRAKVAHYLGALHLQGISLGEIAQIVSPPEYDEDQAYFMGDNLNFIVQFMRNQLFNEDTDTVAFVECAIDVLNQYRFVEEAELRAYFNSSNIEDVFRNADSISFKEFVLLYPESNSSKSIFVPEAIGQPMLESSFLQWTESMFACIFEFWNPTVKSLEVLKRLIRDLPEAISLIPGLWCFYVKNSGKKGMNTLLQFFDDFYKDPLLKKCSQCVQLVKDVVLSVRNYSIAGEKLFEKLYGKLDLQNLFLVLKDTKFSKTALLILDDHMHATTTPKCLSLYNESLTDLYIALDEVDFLSGLPEKSSLRSSLELLNISAPSHELLQYECANFDSLSAFNQKANIKNVSESFLKDGINGIPMLFNESLLEGNSYQWAWKLNKWELPYKEENMNKDEALYSYLYRYQNASNQSDSIYEDIMSDLVKNRRSFDDLSFKDRLALAQEFFEALGSMASVHKIMIMESNEFQKLAGDFNKSDALHQVGLEILQARIIALRNHSIYKSCNEEGKVLATLAQVLEIVKYNDIARHKKLKQKVLNSTLLLDEFVSKCNNLEASLLNELQKRSTFQAAKALWAEGKSEVAIAMCESLTNVGSIELPYEGLSVHHILVNSYKVKWISMAHLDSGFNLLEKHVESMTTAASEIEQIDQRDKVYRLLAEFCDEQFNSKQLNSKIKALKERLQSRKEEVEDIKSHYGKTSVTSAEKKRVQKYYSRLKLQISSQASELDDLTQLKRKFQCYSVKLYLKSILINYNEGIADKLFSLMMEQASDVELQKSIESDLSMIPASTCVNWISQLLSRISTEASTFQSSIKDLILKVCIRHPYHSLYYLISLEYHEDLADENENLAMFMRVKAAKEISRKLNLQTSDYVDTYLRPIDRFCQESVQLSQYKISKSRFLQLDKLKLGYFWLNDLPQIPPPTLEIQVSDTSYENVPKMISIDARVAIATSGLSLPKIATFLLSNGKSHKMLLKHSSDDIRQDAIMEQVFEKVKNLMAQVPEARKRNLTIRTYRAVPLGPKAGIIEFVANTTALIEILRPYHQKRDQMKIESARDMMKSAQNENIVKRVKVYQEITKKIQPVLRGYFVDTFRTPESWYESRLAYSRGVATTSIVGHVLGLGDRHCNNILIDGATGEPVHIDLGVAFDQGKRLPIPETVPFRLTRDIVDGFGITKTRGLFSKACEHTLQILRDNEHRILSILDVLRWDPLYSWSISPIRMNKLQETGEGELGLRPQEDGSDAATALLAVSEKLSAGGLSVSAAVRDLIAEATDENNLAVIYCGWCPFY